MARVTSSRIATFAVMITSLTGAFSANIQINSGAKNLLVGLGNKQVLDCVVTGYQSQTSLVFTWTPHSLDNVTITYQEDSVKNHSVLTIGSFSTKHEGDYTCNYTGSDTNETSVTLSYVIEDKINDVYFFNNKSATLRCGIIFKDGSSGSFLEWRKDNKSVSQLESPERFISDNNGTLTINKPRRTDAGIYIARFNVTGIYGPYYDCEVLYEAGPLVLDMEKSKNVVEDDEFDLTCSIKGYPQPNITWLKDGKAVAPEKGRIIFGTYNGIENATLTVKSARFSDGGIYTCNATLAGQSSSKKIIVRIKGQLEWLWPIIGIICEAIVLSIIIFICSKVKKIQHED